MCEHTNVLRCNCNREFPITENKQYNTERVRELAFLMSAFSVSYLAFPVSSMLQRRARSVVFYTWGDIINPATVYRIVINSASLLPVSGLLQKEHTEADRVQVLEGRQVSCHQIKSEPLPVLQIQEVPSSRHVQRL